MRKRKHIISDTYALTKIKYYYPLVHYQIIPLMNYSPQSTESCNFNTIQEASLKSKFYLKKSYVDCKATMSSIIQINRILFKSTFNSSQTLLIFSLFSSCFMIYIIDSSLDFLLFDHYCSYYLKMHLMFILLVLFLSLISHTSHFVYELLLIIFS